MDFKYVFDQTNRIISKKCLLLFFGLKGSDSTKKIWHFEGFRLHQPCCFDVSKAHLYANLRSLAIFSCFLASSTLTMASVHPSMALLAFIAFGFVFSFGRVRHLDHDYSHLCISLSCHDSRGSHQIAYSNRQATHRILQFFPWGVLMGGFGFPKWRWFSHVQPFSSGSAMFLVFLWFCHEFLHSFCSPRTWRVDSGGSWIGLGNLAKWPFCPQKIGSKM